jgi:hypothetical protein
MRDRGIPLDFFSFHRYTDEPHKMRPRIEAARALCDEYGYPHAEIHLNEWNYIRSFVGEAWTYSLHAEKGLKGASFTTGCMCVGQDTALDMLMYYDARPCSMNGMFDTDFLTPLKGYYPFKFFGALYRMGEAVKPIYEESPIYCTAARGNGKMGILLTNFHDDDNAPAEEVTLCMEGVAGKTARICMLDSERDGDVTEVCTLASTLTLMLPLYSVCYIEIE